MRVKLSKKVTFFLAIPFAVIVFFAVMGILFSAVPTEEELNEKFIVVNPLDLSQIRAFSKYRSCMGHDYRNPTAREGIKETTPRSMKHYIKVKEELMGKNEVVKAIAPFDGKISNIEKSDPERKPYDQQIWLTPDNGSLSPRQWNFVFFHIDLRDDLKQGSQVKAGEVIGTAYMTRGPENSTDNFDMAVKFTRPMAEPAVDFPLAHATDEVLSEYEADGITLADMEISKEYRDQNLCKTTGDSQAGDVYFERNTDPNDMVYLRSQ